MSEMQDVLITEDFLLDTVAARTLYHEYAADLPIIDYHCHLLPEEIALDIRWENMSQVWLSGDHYKWRAMRTNGVPEDHCTGSADDYAKFEKWAATMPSLLRNPLYHWTHLELKRYFGIGDRLLGPDTARAIWEECNERLCDPNFSSRGLMKKSGVVLACTTDDPVDSLEHHAVLAADDSFGVRVYPTWRPDKGMMIESPDEFNAWIDKLSAAADVDIVDFGTYLTALRNRHAFFHENGCRMSDHGIETAYAENYTDAEIGAIFAQVRGGSDPSCDDVLKFKSAMLYEFALMDWEKGWVQQFHFGAMRNNNTRLYKQLGSDKGFDSIADVEIARPLSRFLDRLDSENKLAKTILYNLNPRDNMLMVSMIGNFQDGSVPGKMQYGSGWWFLDQKDGMERQMADLSQAGLLSRFIGMVTDSRSFLSYTRHEYFRRILCNMLGDDMTKGLVPNDMALVGRMMRDISYNNAAAYLGFDGLGSERQ